MEKAEATGLMGRVMVQALSVRARLDEKETTSAILSRRRFNTGVLIGRIGGAGPGWPSRDYYKKDNPNHLAKEL